MNSFNNTSSRIILVGAVGIWVAFFLAYNSNFSCVNEKVAPLTWFFNCTDPNHMVEELNYNYIAPGLGASVVLAALRFDLRRGFKFEFWVTMSVLTLALVIMPLYTLLVTATGQPTGLHEGLFKLTGGGPFVLTNEYRAPVITSNEQFALSLMSVISGMAIGPMLDRAWKSRRQKQLDVGAGFPI